MKYDSVIETEDLACLRASLGEFIPLQEVRAMLDDAIRKQLEEMPAEEVNAQPTEEGGV
mgnify:CR=1 FL=1